MDSVAASTSKTVTTRLDGQSLNVAAETLNQLRELVPSAFSEGKLDFDKLRQVLGEDIYVIDERYGLNWPGKADAYKEIQRQTTATLVPALERSVDWDSTGNVFIEGENLEVLRVLQRAYFGKVKMIYIDPPYNTGSDSFVYPDDYTERRDEFLRRSGATDEHGYLNKQDLWRANTKESGQYHSAWLGMMLPRLFLSRNLLRSDGVIFVSIDDNEVSNLRLLLDEVFGPENFVGQLVWQRSKKGDAKMVAVVHEYVLCYARDKNATLAAGIWRKKKAGADEVLAKYSQLKKALAGDHGKIREAMQAWYKSLAETDPRKAHKHYNWSDDRGLYFADNFAGPDDGRDSRPRHDIFHPDTKQPCKKPSTGWRWDQTKTDWALAQVPMRIHFGPDENTIPNRKSYLEEISSEPFSSVFYRDGRSATLEVEGLVGKGVFPFPKNTEVLTELIELVTKEGDLVLDYFAGSGSTGHAVMQLNTEGGNRRFLLVQMQELVAEDSAAYRADYRTIADITQARLKNAATKYKTAAAGKLALSGPASHDVGFRTYQLEYSNFKPWQAEVEGGKEGILAQLSLFQEPLHDSGPEAKGAMLTELLLKAGYPLNTPVSIREIGGLSVQVVAGSSPDGGALWLALNGLNAEIMAAAGAEKAARVVVPGDVFDETKADQEISNARLTLEEAGVNLQLI